MVDSRQTAASETSPVSTDLTCDFGESFGNWNLGDDAAVAPLITSANIACGFHAGDPTVMRKTVQLAAEHGVQVGAHVGFADLRGFGRRPIEIESEDLRNDVIYQYGALAAICQTEGVTIRHLKPHGALYDMAATDRRYAEVIVRAVAEIDPSLLIYTTWNSAVNEFADELGIGTVHEVYADRAINADGSEIPGYDLDDLGGSVEAAVERVVTAVTTGRLRATDGSEVDWSSTSVCFHGDTPDALRFGELLNLRLGEAGVVIAASHPGSG